MTTKSLSLAFLAVCLAPICDVTQATDSAHQVILENKYDLRSCSGSFITKKHVLTAAACVCGCNGVDRTPHLEMVAARYRTNSLNGHLLINKIHCQEVAPNFCDPIKLRKNVAVIELKGSITPSAKTHPISTGVGAPNPEVKVYFNTIRGGEEFEIEGVAQTAQTCFENEENVKTTYQHERCAYSNYTLFPALGNSVIENGKLVGVVFDAVEYTSPKKYFYRTINFFTVFLNSVVPFNDFMWEGENNEWEYRRN